MMGAEKLYGLGASLCLNFLLCKIGIIIVLTMWD